jgi:two-component system, chemotaxis family, chemotaxis protein CheY
LTAYNLQNVNVLVIEGHQVMRRLMHDVLGTLGIKTVEVISSAQLQQIDEFDADVIFADWSPICDGLALSRDIRLQKGKLDRFSPIVMMSAYTELRRVCEARDAGVTEFLAKPYTATLVYRRICSLVENPRDFVETKAYFGPDRRRRALGPTGAERRRDMSGVLVGAGRTDGRPRLHDLVR